MCTDTLDTDFRLKTIYIISVERKIIRVDMDQVLAELYDTTLVELQKRYPDVILKNKEEHTEHWLSREYPHYKDRIYSIFSEKGFFRNLPPIEGAIEAIREMMERHNVSLCTSPFDSKYCKREKVEWKNEYFGKSMPIYFAHDKTRYPGYCIIDDNPEITGRFIHKNPWEKIIVHSQTYNRHIVDSPEKKRMDWSNHKEVLSELW